MTEQIRVINADCLEAMVALAREGVLVDAAITDAPYHLTSIVKRFGAANSAPARGNSSLGGAYARASKGFMGKEWDGGDIAFRVDTWRKVFAIMKPGAHLIAFSGTRTYHRMAVAIEDAGFEIRDQLAWCYGSGFPKSHDVGAGVDKLDVVGPRRERALKFTAWMRSTGMTAKRINALTNTVMGSHYLTDKEQPEIPTEDMFCVLRPHLKAVPDWVEELVRSRTVESENAKRRPVVGQHEKVAHAAAWRAEYEGGTVAPAKAITTAFSDEAKAWEGWGTALKPAWEPIVFARKPLDKDSIAANVLKHGTGAINIDACRIEGEGDALDRWPANILHDGSPEVAEAFGIYAAGAVRFFYSAKADAADRFGSRHPTVKPIDLMAWLVRMVTPKGGLVLDMFAGSGTTGIAALREGCRAILIEREPEYFADINARLEHARGEGKHSASVRARHKAEPDEPLPLFGVPKDAAE